MAQLHLTLFECDKRLLRVFLETREWPVAEGFAHDAMGYDLYRQAHGLAQHPSSMDVFCKLPELGLLQDIDTLDDLANALFTV